jgi:hypothetical protein
VAAGAGAHRQGGDLTAALWAELIELPRPDDSRDGALRDAGHEGSSQTVHYLPGFSHPAQPALFQTVWPALAGSLVELGQAGIDVIVDLGRISSAGAVRAAGPPAELVSLAAALGVVSRTGLRSLAGLSLHREQIDGLARQTTASVGLVLVGSGRPYSAGEIQGEFGLPVLAEVTDDARAASVLSDGAGLVSGSIPRGWGRGRYVSSLRHAAGALHKRMVRQAGIAEQHVGLTGQPWLDQAGEREAAEATGRGSASGSPSRREAEAEAEETP